MDSEFFNSLTVVSGIYPYPYRTMRDHLLVIVTAIVCFWLGTLFPGHHEETPHTINLISPERPTSFKTSVVLELEEQVEAHRQFQSLLMQTQESSLSCNRRVLRYTVSTESKSLVDALHGMARALQVALATERRLVAIALSPTEETHICGNQNVPSPDTPPHYCLLWKERAPACLDMEASSNPVVVVDKSDSDAAPVRQGILPTADDSSSDFFNVQFYGNMAQVDLPPWPWKKSWLLDTLEEDRHWGRLWVKSEILHYLWEQRLRLYPHPVPPPPTRPSFVAVVLDSYTMTTTLREQFGRNATKTHDWNRILMLVHSIRKQDSRIETLYLAVNGSFPQVQEWEAITSTSNDYNTFYTPIGDDFQMIQTLRQADYLIGSFANPWFRLGVELNTAHHTSIGRYPLSQRRHFGLDIEWYEDP